MKLNIQLFYKLFLVALLFINGLVIVAAIFPLINLCCSSGRARVNRDLIKMIWLRCFSAIINLRVDRYGELPERTGIIVSNHISWLDIIVIGQYLPAYFVAKSDILSWPVIGYIAKQVGTIFIRRGDKKHIMATAEKMLWMLKQNSNIIAFPEGTTTRGDRVLNFHASLFQPALLTKSVIQPVVIQYQGNAREIAPFIGDDAFIPHLLKILSQDKIEVRLGFLSSINGTSKSRHTVSSESRELILKEVCGVLSTDNLTYSNLKISDG